MVIDHLLVAVLAYLPPEPVFAIAGKWRLVTCADGVSSLRLADQIGRHHLFPVEPAAVQVQVQPPTEVRNAHEDSPGRLHVIVGFFETAADYLARIRPIGGDDIRSRDLQLLGARL